MSQIKATNTKPELLVRKFLHPQGFRYTLHGGQTRRRKALAGKPDCFTEVQNRHILFMDVCMGMPVETY